MTAVTAPGATKAVPKPPADLRKHTRWLLAILLPIGPAAVAVLRYVLPYLTLDDTQQILQQVAADPDRQSLILWLAFVAFSRSSQARWRSVG